MEDNWKFDHVGVMVADIDEVVEYYKSLGIAKFRPPRMFDASRFAEWKIYGKTPETLDQHKCQYLDIGPLALEMLQTVSGVSIHDDFVNKVGEGMEHVGFTVDNLEEETAMMVKNGMPVIVSGKREDGTGFAYFDLRKGGNIIIELIQRAK